MLPDRAVVSEYVIDAVSQEYSIATSLDCSH